MKKLIVAAAAVIALCACSGKREYLDYRGLSLGMSAKAMCDSLLQRGFVLDSNYTDESSFVLSNAQELSRVDIVHHNDTITDVVESYTATYNDSTSQLWQKIHDQLVEEGGRQPMMAHRADLHKEAIYQNKKGTIKLILLNTYSPTLTIRYSTEIVDYSKK